MSSLYPSLLQVIDIAKLVTLTALTAMRAVIAAIMGFLEFPNQENHSHPWKEDSGLLSKHSFASHIKYDEDSPKPIISLWMNILISPPDWNVNNSASFLIDILCSHSYFFLQAEDTYCRETGLWSELVKQLSEQKQL